MGRMIICIVLQILFGLQVLYAENLRNETSFYCANDWYFDDQWNLTHDQYGINFCNAKAITQGNNNIRIAIISDGVFTGHEDLIVTESFGIDEYNNYNGNPSYGPKGTKCAGIINAQANNSGICGIAPNCYLISIAIEAPSPDAYTAAFQHALWRNADIILWLWDSFAYEPDFFLEQAIIDALYNGRNGKGTIVVFASGDSFSSQTLIDEAITYPANLFDEVLVVGAIKQNGHRPSRFLYQDGWSSCYGANLDVVAPGVNIPTTSYQNNYGTDMSSYDTRFSSTSAAAAHVAAIAGLLLSVNPDLTRERVNNIIEKTARKLSAYDFTNSNNHPNGTWNYEVGYGVVDAYLALQELMGTKYIQNTTYNQSRPINVDDKDTIIAGYAVTNTMPYGNVVVQAGSNVTYKARTRIELRPGFRVEQGATFKAIIEAPSQQSSAPSNVRRRELFTANNEEDNHDDAVIEKPQNNTFSILPNPVNAILHLQTDEELSQVNIYNLNGQCVLQASQADIDVSALPQGMYILRAETTDGNAHQAKFIKQ